jgi:hypothetical protein
MPTDSVDRNLLSRLRVKARAQRNRREPACEDVDRLRVAREALSGFRSAVERSQPNSRVRTLGLA